MLLIISIDKEGEVYIYIDRTYTIYADDKNHLGLYLIIGKEAMINISKKLGLVTTSSTEMEVVTNSEHFPKYS